MQQVQTDCNVGKESEMTGTMSAMFKAIREDQQYIGGTLEHQPREALRVEGQLDKAEEENNGERANIVEEVLWEKITFKSTEGEHTLQQWN